MWLLDNMLPHPGRVYTIDRTDTALINVMLDVKDATRDLKLAPDGQEARNDCISFESVKVREIGVGERGGRSGEERKRYKEDEERREYIEGKRD